MQIAFDVFESLPTRHISHNADVAVIGIFPIGERRVLWTTFQLVENLPSIAGKTHVSNSSNRYVKFTVK